MKKLSCEEKSDMGFAFTNHQKITMLVFCFVAFLCGLQGSLQAPFYPKEAKNKDANKTHVGLVFAIYHFTIFTTSPFFGKYHRKIGIKRMICLGIILMGSCAIAFGLLDLVQNSSIFIALSYSIRGIEALGHSSFKTATFTMVTREFPETTSILFASLQASFGLGLTLGPFIGAILYNLGGFFLPFAITGALIIISSIMTYRVVPSHFNDPFSDRAQHVLNVGILDALKIPDIFLQALSTLSATISIGFLQATLRNHIGQFRLSESSIGITF